MEVRQAVTAAMSLGRTGLLRPAWPSDYLRMARLAHRWGASLATAAAISALRVPRQPAVVDDEGTLSWRDLEEAANALSHELGSLGVGSGSTVGLMCRNNRYFVEVTLAASKLGADLVLLNTEVGPHQLGDVLRREGIGVSVFDDEFASAFDAAGFCGPAMDRAAIRRATASGRGSPPAPPSRPGRIVFMTSGATGLPKGAQRRKLAPPTAMVVSAMSRLPLRVEEPFAVSPPLFHALGFGFMGAALGLQGTLILQSRFDPEALLAAVSQHRATTLVAVPVMLRRILAVPELVRRHHDTSSLRAIVCSGSSLGPELASAVMDRFGDILYNFYGSTEVGWATMAGPGDLRRAPGTTGRPPAGTRVAILDEAGRALGPGRTGRIFVGSGMVFEGYTGGGGKPVVAGLTGTGDTGHLDEAGRLFVDGREDEMIVSGGENVFPGEVEELLRGHSSVTDAAVVGTDDEEMGQRLVAFVVPSPGSSLSADDIRAYVRGRLARYKVPRDVTFVDEVPRNAMGKVLRSSLKASAGSG
jgi:fatty-acyl-CoA synthase